MIRDPRPHMKDGNVCFYVKMTDEDHATIAITNCSVTTNPEIIGRNYTVEVRSPLAHVRRGNGPGNLEYVLAGQKSRLEKDDEVNALIRYDERLGKIELISITPEHELRNLLSQPKKRQSTPPGTTEDVGSINQLEDAFLNAGALRPGGGTSDGGTAKDVDHVSDDPRTTQRKVAKAPRPKQRERTTTAA